MTNPRPKHIAPPINDPHYDALIEQAVRSQAELRSRLTSPDPAVRRAAESEVRKAAIAFIMDTRLGGP